MVHRKYTYKNGKRFGPYYYETKRVNGKVITTYLGSKLPRKKKRFEGLPALGILLVLLLAFLFFPLDLTGKASLDVGARYRQGEVLTGELRLDLKAGELIPAETAVSISLGNETRTLLLSDIVEDSLIQGEFYAESSDLSGSGRGYGLIGEKQVYPDVGFELFIFDFEKAEGEDEVSEETAEEIEESNITIGEELNESIDDGFILNKTESDETVVNETGQDIEIDSNESEVEEGTQEVEGEIIEEVPEEVKESEEIEEGAEKGLADSEETGEEVKEVSDEELESPEVSITGEVISVTEGESPISIFFRRIFSRVTGFVIEESLGNEKIISGTVNRDNNFEYELEERQSAKIFGGSVKVDGGGIGIDGVNLNLRGNKAVVTTDYFVIEEGFGEEYLRGGKKRLNIDLEDFNIIVQNESLLSVEVTYDAVKIVDVNTDISILPTDIAEIEDIVNETISNETIFNETIDFIEVNTTQFTARLDEPVKWTKRLNASKPVSVNVEIPLEALNVSVIDIEEYENVIKDIIEELEEEIDGQEETSENVSEKDGEEVSEETEENITEEDFGLEKVSVGITGRIITGDVTADIELERSFSLIEWFKGLLSITGFAIVNATDDNGIGVLTQDIVVEINGSGGGVVDIEYFTDAPLSIEEDIDNGKRVKVSSPEGIDYESVLIFANISEFLEVRDPVSVRVYWQENDTYLDSVNVSDLNRNGIYDYVEWVAPHLSNQTFDIIVIVNAEHLDANRTFVSNIFEEVKALDGNWSETIPDTHYVRVVFERNLTSNNDITVYPRTVNGTPKIEIYEFNETEIVTEFPNLIDNEYNKVLLTSLGNRTQDRFDLLILNGSVEFDHIVDPTVNISSDSTKNNVSLQNSFSHLAIANMNISFINRTNVILYMPFDANTSINTTYDYSPIGNNGTITGNEFFEGSTGGIHGGSFGFDGDNDHINLPSIIAGLPVLTVSMWVRSNIADTGSIRPFDQDGTGADSIAMLRNSAERYVCRIRNDAQTSGVATADPILQDTNWHHIVCIYDGSIVQIYVDGVAEDDTPPSLTGVIETTPATTLMIGHDGTDAWNGSIDEVLVLNISLNSSQVTDLFNNQSGRLFSRGEQLFEEVNASVDGDENRINVTLDQLLNFADGTENFTIQVGNSTASGYDYTQELQVDTTTNQTTDIAILDSDNISIKVIFNSDSNNFYSPVLQHDITIDSWNQAAGDTVSPGVTVIFPRSVTYGPQHIPLNFNVTLSENGSVQYSLDNGVANVTMSGDEGNLFGTEFNATNSSIGDGSYTFSVYANDTAGNKNYTESVVFDFDSTNPTISFVSPTPSNASRQTNTDIYANLSSSDSSDHYSFVDFDDDVFLWLRTDDANATDVFDLSSYSNNGSLFGDAFVNLTGYFGNGSHFDGLDDATDDFINVSGLRNNPRLLDSFSISVWVYTRHTGDIRDVLGTQTGSCAAGVNGTVLRITSSAALQFCMSNVTDFENANGPSAISANQWTHVAAIYNHTTPSLHVYKNGAPGTIQTATALHIGAASENQFTIGFVSQPLRLWNGSIDEIILFNRSLTSAEVSALYNASADQYFRNFTLLEVGKHTFTGYTADIIGNKNQTEEIHVNVTTAPRAPTPEINSTDGSDYADQDLNCFDTLSDDDADLMNVTVKWLNGSTELVLIDYNESYTNGTFLGNLTLNSANTTKGETWRCSMKVFDGTDSSSYVNSSALVIVNAPPTVPTRSTPTDGASVTDRTPTFTWTASTDVDSGDTLTYDLNVTLVASSACTDTARLEEGLTGTTDDLNSDLLCFFDNADFYNWTMRANDGSNYSDWFVPDAINLSSSIVLSVPNSSVEFGSVNISVDGNDDTTDDSPVPFGIQNDGNAISNITIQATDLWTTQTNPSQYYQFKVANYTFENFSFFEAISVLTFTNTPNNSTATLAIGELNWTNATDIVEVDINITVPPNEGSGVKSSIATFVGSLAEG